jgi:hypothetical protein
MSRDSVQDAYFDASGALYPGQIADYGTSADYSTVGAPAEGNLYVGRAYIKKSDIAPGTINRSLGFTVGPVEAGSAAEDILGIVIRTEACKNDANGLPYYADGEMASITLPGNSPQGFSFGANAHVAIDVNDPVYVSVVPADSGIPIGEFGKAGGVGSGMIGPITGWKWKYAAADGEVGVIQI